MTHPREPEDPQLEESLRQWLRAQAPAEAPADLAGRSISGAVQGPSPRTWRAAFPAALHNLGSPRPLVAVTSIIVVPLLVVALLSSRPPEGPAASPMACEGTAPTLEPGGSPPTIWVVGSLTESRLGHTATHIGGCRVLLVGGAGSAGAASGRVELWDAASESVTRLPPLLHARRWHASILLEDGRVLVAGGGDPGPVAGEGDPAPQDAPGGPILEAEVWDPRSMSAAPAGHLEEAYTNFIGVPLLDGRVLMLAGGAGSSATVWLPESDTFHPTGSMRDARVFGYTATRLPDGRVVVIGGGRPRYVDGQQVPDVVLASVEVWDPVTGQFSDAPPLPEGRYQHTATLLPDGRILVAGGVAGDATGPRGAASTSLIRDPVSGEFHASGDLLQPRARPAAGLLPNGQVVLIAGVDVENSAELWDPDTGAWMALPPLPRRSGGQATFLPDGTVLMSGGLRGSTSEDGIAEPFVELERYDPMP